MRSKVGVFVELHRKAKQAEDLNVQLRQMSNRLMTLQDDERRRVARELHDRLVQDLAAAKLIFAHIVEDSGQSKDQLATNGIEILDGAIQQVRTISYLLHPPLLDEAGLASALRLYLEGVSKRSGIKTFLDLLPQTFPRLAPDIETAIFRIVQEALANVFRHSGCWHATSW